VSSSPTNRKNNKTSEADLQPQPTNKQWETKRKTLKLICNSNKQNKQTNKQTAEKINFNTGNF